MQRTEANADGKLEYLYKLPNRSACRLQIVVEEGKPYGPGVVFVES